MQFFKVATAAATATILTFTGGAAAATAITETGDFTYYTPGLGACGWTSGEGDYVVAVSAHRFNSEKDCGRKIKATRDGKSVEVEVVDRCAACSIDDLDFSPAAYQKMATLDEGRVKGTWAFT